MEAAPGAAGSSRAPADGGWRPCVVDVALFYGRRSGGIRTYLDAKAAWAARTGAVDHHLIVPGAAESHVRTASGGRHELPSAALPTGNGYRWPLGGRRLEVTIRALRPDVVLLHDPFWSPVAAAAAAHRTGAAVVQVHHGSVALGALALPGPQGVHRALLRRLMHRAYAPADGVMSACDSAGDTGRSASMPLRFGVHPAFAPDPISPRGDHVLYAGRLAREKGIFTLLDAAARSPDPWPLVVLGAGPALGAARARARRLGIAQRVSWRPFEADRAALARAYRAASCVVMPGPHETFGLVALEAAASGARVVACDTAPSSRRVAAVCHTFARHDAAGLECAVRRARSAPRDLAAARAIVRDHAWDAAFAAESRDLRALAVLRAAAVPLVPGRPG